MTTFVRAANPIWWLPDLTGVSLNDEYYAFFLTNTFPYVPQAVYQDSAGANPWPSPLEFSPAGTLPDNLYFDPTLVYRIEVRHGNTQADALIWEINNFVPGEGGGSSVVIDELTVAANLITNPQFADIDFQSPYTFTTVTPGTYTIDVGPGWELVLSGTGTTVLTQTAIAGSSNLAGNPPYFLDINNNGWTTAILRQRLENNGALFANGAIAVALTAAAVTTPETLTVTYAPNSGTATNIFQKSIPVGALIAYSGAIDLPASTNASTGTAAYVDIDFVLPGTGELQLTNIQIVGQSTNLSSGFDTDTDIPAFRELSYEQVENGEFNVYKSGLIYKQTPNILVGWDFPLNPAQFNTDTISAVNTGNNKSFYAWDQTIVFQKTTSSCHISRNIAGSFDINNDVVGNQVAVIQYLDQQQARKFLNQPLAVNVAGLFLAGLKVTISLWYTTDASLPNLDTGSYLSLVATLDANGKPATFNGNWTEITRDIGTDATFLGNGPVTLDYTDYSFNGWNIGNSTISNSVTFFAIVIGTAPISSTLGGEVDINSVNLVNGSIATRPAPQTADQVLRECQYYYEKSYDLDVKPGTVNAHSALIKPMLGRVVGGDTVLNVMPFSVEYKQAKRVKTPGFTFYSPGVGTAGSVGGQIFSNIYQTNASVEIVAGTTWSPTYGQYGVQWLPLALVGNFGATGSNVAPPIASINFHYIVEARLGIV
jgi:hypothetical protein